MPSARERLGRTARAASLAAVLCGLSPGAVAAAASRPLRDCAADYMAGDLETAIIPTPQRAALKETVFEAGKVAVVRPDRYDAPPTVFVELGRLLGDGNMPVIPAGAFDASKVEADTLIVVGRHAAGGVLAGLVGESAGEADALRQARAARDGYVLRSAAGALAGRNVVALSGTSPAGDFWALATLRQMTFRKGGRRYIRQGRIVDFPRFRFRGNKRPRQWEWRYKANYGWQGREVFAGGSRGRWRRDYFRQHGAWIHHGDPLRATEAEMDALLAGYTDARGRKVAGAAACYQVGCREFVLKFDDTGSRLSEATKRAFDKGDARRAYFAALRAFLAGMHRRIKALDEANRVFFMPRPYWHNSAELDDFARALRAAGPLPKDMHLSVCGPEVISWRIPTACLRDYRELFGVTGKAQIYDNFGRGGEYVACRGRSRDLWKEVACLFGERGTPVTRITVYDYLWNPEAYDPQRSLRLAARELSSRRGEVYKALLDYLLYYNAHRDFTDCPSPTEARKRLPQVNRTMKARFDALAPLLASSPLAEEVRLRAELWGPEAPRSSYEWGEYARLRRRLQFEPYMARYGWRQGRAAATDQAVRIDGRLDEPAWRRAPAFPDFVQKAWGMKAPPEDLAAMRLPPAEATRMKMLHSDTHIYVGVTFGCARKPTVPGWALRQWKDVPPGGRGHYAWRVPCIEMMFDVTARREHYYWLVANIADVHLSAHCRAYRTGKTGGYWRPGVRFAFDLGPSAGTFEASIPLADLCDKPPRAGDVWGFQAYRSKMGTFGVFSGTYDLVGGEHATREFGRIVFE